MAGGGTPGASSFGGPVTVPHKRPHFVLDLLELDIALIRDVPRELLSSDCIRANLVSIGLRLWD